MRYLNQDDIDISNWCVTIKDAANSYHPFKQYVNNKNKIDLGDSEALTLYNQAIAKIMLDIDINISPMNLIPAICVRNAYAKLISEWFSKNFPSYTRNAIEIGTGPTAIISLILAKKYNFNVISTELDLESYNRAKENITINRLNDRIKLIKSEGQILKNLINDSNINILLSYPPVYPEEDSYKYNTSNQNERGFGGSISEMIGGGSTGFNFIEQMLIEAIDQFNIPLISYLSIFEKHIQPGIQILQERKYQIKIFKLNAGTRVRYIVIGYKK